MNEVLKQRNESTKFMLSLSKSDKEMLVSYAKKLNTTISSLVRHLIRTNKSINDL